MSCQHGEQIGMRKNYPKTRARVATKRVFIFRKPYRPAVRTYLEARAIATYLRAFPFLLGLRTARLIGPIRIAFGCSQSTAMRGIGIARSSP
jgi:hypothetical protein